MTRFFLPLTLLGMLLLTSSCRHRATHTFHSHEEATPVSELGDHDFSRVTPARHKRH